jgi:hypothetical protein
MERMTSENLTVTNSFSLLLFLPHATVRINSIADIISKAFLIMVLSLSFRLAFIRTALVKAGMYAKKALNRLLSYSKPKARVHRLFLDGTFLKSVKNLLEMMLYMVDVVVNNPLYLRSWSIRTGE